MPTFNFKQTNTTIFGIISGLILIFSYIFFYKNDYFLYTFAALFFSSFTLTNDAKLLNYRSVLPYFFAIVIFGLLYSSAYNFNYTPIHISITVILFGLFFCSHNDKVLFKIDSVKSFSRARLYLISMIFATLASLLAGSILLAIHALFEVKIPRFLEAIPYGLAPFLFCQLLEFFKIKNLNEEEKIKSQINRTLSAVLVPALSIYSIILFLYLVKLLITQNFPKGYATWPASISIALWLFIESFQDIYKLKNNWIRKILPLPGVLLLILGVSLRVGEYGLTLDRIYLVFWLALTSLTYSHFALKGFLSIRTIIASLLIFLIITTLPYFNLNRIAAYSQWKIIEKTLLRLDATKLDNLISDESAITSLRSSLKLVEKVRSKGEIKVKLKTLIPSFDSKKIDQFYETISDANNSAPKEEGVCINIEQNPNVVKNSSLSHYLSFHLIGKDSKTYPFDDGSVQINLARRSATIIVKMPGENDQIFDFEKDVKVDENLPTVLKGSFKKNKFEILIESGSTCNDGPVYLNGRFYFDKV